MQGDKSVPDSLKDKFAGIQRKIERLRKADIQKPADDLAAKLRGFAGQLAGPIPPAGKGQVDLHVVGLYEGAYPNGERHSGNNHPQDVATVELKSIGQPIVLVLTAYEPVKWELRLGKRVTIQKLILQGYYGQEAIGLPKDVPVVNEAGQAFRKRIFAYKRDQVRNYYPLVKRLREITGLEITTFQGTYAYRGNAFVIGPENSDWRIQLVERRMDSLHRTATRFERDRQREEVQSIRFQAMCHPPTNYQQRFRTVNFTWGAFTPTGPIAKTLKPVGKNTKQLAVDPRGPRFFTIGRNGVAELYLGAEKTQSIDIAANLPKLSWPCGLAFDTKRRRLILTSLGGEGFMYSYAVDDKKWSLVTSMNNIDLSCLAYSAERDVFVGLKTNHAGNQGTLLTFSATGALLQQTPLDKRIPFDRQLHQSVTQIAAAGRQVVIIAPPRPDLQTPGNPITSRIYLVDPRSGKILFSSISQPHADRRTFNADELAEIWNGLLTSDGNAADKLMWQLAAGQDVSVAFLQKQFKPFVKADKQLIQQLIRQLDSEDFKTRQAAHKKLNELGGLAGTELADAAKNHPSTEVRTRARRILDRVERGAGSAPEPRRELRAIDVLGRIATASAAKVLEGLAAQNAAAVRTRKAKETLNRIEQSY